MCLDKEYDGMCGLLHIQSRIAQGENIQHSTQHTLNKGTGPSSFLLKIVAIVSMTLNHLGTIFSTYLPEPLVVVLIACGGFAFPIMAFLIGEGYRHTRSIKKYLLRLFIFALIAELPYWLFLEHGGNVIFTLFLGLLVLYFNDVLKNRILFWLSFAAIILVSGLCDWGFVGPIMVYLYATQKGMLNRFIVPVLLPALGMGLLQLALLTTEPNPLALGNLLYLVLGCGLTIPLLVSYRGSRGPSAKYLFYVYYPLHILLLGLAKGLLFSDWS